MDIQLEPKDLTQEYGVSTTKLNPKRDIRPITGSGTGDVVGPASAVNDDIAVYDGTSGKIIKDSGLKVTGFVKTDQASAQTIGDATNRLAKAYADDLSVFGNLEFYDPATENLSWTLTGEIRTFDGLDTQFVVAKDSNSATEYSHVVGRAVKVGDSEVAPTGKLHTARTYFGSDYDHYLVRDTDDLYWKNGSTYQKLNGTGGGGWSYISCGMDFSSSALTDRSNLSSLVQNGSDFSLEYFNLLLALPSWHTGWIATVDIRSITALSTRNVVARIDYIRASDGQEVFDSRYIPVVTWNNNVCIGFSKYIPSTASHILFACLLNLWELATGKLMFSTSL